MSLISTLKKELCNGITNVILPSEAAEEFLNLDENGTKSYELFTEEWLQGNNPNLKHSIVH